jgi:hypothetical protein
MFVPSPVSSTNASPTEVASTALFVELIVIQGAVLVKERLMRRKHISHRNGPIVEPWPGPNKRRE